LAVNLAALRKRYLVQLEILRIVAAGIRCRIDATAWAALGLDPAHAGMVPDQRKPHAHPTLLPAHAGMVP